MDLIEFFHNHWWFFRYPSTATKRQFTHQVSSNLFYRFNFWRRVKIFPIEKRLTWIAFLCSVTVASFQKKNFPQLPELTHIHNVKIFQISLLIPFYRHRTYIVYNTRCIIYQAWDIFIPLLRIHAPSHSITPLVTLGIHIASYP